MKSVSKYVVCPYKSSVVFRALVTLDFSSMEPNLCFLKGEDKSISEMVDN